MESGILRILESKGHKDRDVPLSADMLDLCRNYHRQVQRLLPDPKYFFPGSNGNAYSKGGVDEAFRVLWRRANIPPGNGNQPRPYDFRHTFATQWLCQWLSEGKDLTAHLPYLSAYLGHAQLSDTAYYIHLTPASFPQLHLLKLDEYAALLPEVDNGHE